MKYDGDKMGTYCETCRTRRRIVRCSLCWGKGETCYMCQRTGYVCEESNGDRLHEWKKSWE